MAVATKDGATECDSLNARLAAIEDRYGFGPAQTWDDILALQESATIAEAYRANNERHDLLRDLAANECSGADSNISTTSTSLAARALTDREAATAFVQAWTRSDAAAMAAVGEPEAVRVALHFDDPEPPTDCTTQASGQYQCLVNVAGDDRMYFLVGGPGASEGRVWWVAEYHET